MGTAAIIRIQTPEDRSKVWSEHIGMTVDGVPEMILEIVERLDAKFQAVDPLKVDFSTAKKIMHEVCEEYNNEKGDGFGSIFVSRTYKWITNFACFDPVERYLEVENRITGRLHVKKLETVNAFAM